MTEGAIFQQTGLAYLSLIHPLRLENAYREEIAPVLALAPSAPNQVIAEMITGDSWRERLLGLCLATKKSPEPFIEPMLLSLRDPRGIVIVPTSAALAVLARHGLYAMRPSFRDDVNRKAFDGEIGWAADKALHHAGLYPDNVSGNGPNYGQVFDDHVEVYNWILTS